MPIKFRCPRCRQFLGISRSKAGAVTDCPTCGRTIRVPDLDGTISPLPRPELDYADRGLAQALNELANLGAGEEENQANAEGRNSPPLPKPVAMGLAPPPSIKAVALPAQLPPSPLPSVGSSKPKADSASDDHPSISNSDKLIDPLKELAAMSPPGRGDVRPQSRSTAQLLSAGAGCVFVGLVTGVFIGRMTIDVERQADSPAAISPPSVAPVAVSPAPVVSGQGAPTISPPLDGAAPAGLPPAVMDRSQTLAGHVSYINADGESRPDSGARILVLPPTREGTSKLGVDSFRTGGGDADLRVAQASIRALGGDFAVSDSDGRYEVQLPVAGEYRLIIVSRYQGRGSGGEGDRAEIAALKDWFDKPQLFLGQTQSTLAAVQFDGKASQIRDHLFPKAE